LILRFTKNGLAGMTGNGKSMGYGGWRSVAATLHGGLDSLYFRFTAPPVSAPRFTGLRQMFPHIERGLPEQAQDLYRGKFEFAGILATSPPADIFRLPPPNAAWAAELAGFAWLSHLEAAGFVLYWSFARAMIEAWCNQGRSVDLGSDCTRLLAFARHAGFLLTGASASFERRFLMAVSRETRRLRRRPARKPNDAVRQWASLLAASLAFRGGDELRLQALNAVTRSLAVAFLPDGGPASRNPRDLVDLLLILIPLRDMLEGQRISIPPPFAAIIDRALPMLRMLCHGDGGLALFQGADGPLKSSVRAVLDHDGVGGESLLQAPHSGFCRLAQGETAVIVDCGQPRLCHSELAFEFSDGSHRIVGNCGMPRRASEAWRSVATTTAAHSTLDHRATRTRPEANVELSAYGALLSSRCAAHKRDLYLAASGLDLRGEDRIRPGQSGFILRFHLHPSVRTWQDRKGANILMMLPNQASWKFTARGGLVSLEDSVFLATGGAPQECRQIVVRGDGPETAVVNWAFKKLDRKPRQRASPGVNPQLPF
jgi:uncharacterized heparinase superfamily protein